MWSASILNIALLLPTQVALNRLLEITRELGFCRCWICVQSEDFFDKLRIQMWKTLTSKTFDRLYQGMQLVLIL
jgi:hypothetical protein